MVRLWFAMLLLVACKQHEAASVTPARSAAGAPANPAVGMPVKPGTLRRSTVETGYAIAVAAGADVPALEKLARQRGRALEVSRASLADVVNDQELALMTRGLAATDVERLKASPALIVVHGSGPEGVKLAREIAGVTRDVADAARGWVLDFETFRVHPAASFHAHVPGERLDVRQLIAVHAIQGENRQPYLSTAGLRRYGLPELHVADAASGQIEALTHLINGAAQLLLDGGDVTERGELVVDFHRLGWTVGIIEHGTGKAVWTTRWAREPDAGAGGDLVVALVPVAGAGVAGASKMIAECFGSMPDTVTHLATDDAELLAAAAKARADLVALQRRYPKGLPFDHRLTVKAKFTGNGEVEWMWVDVVAIKEGSFEGTLANDPALIDTLHHGAKVKVQLADVGDYLLEQKGGPTAGGYSLEVLKKRGLIPGAAGP